MKECSKYVGLDVHKETIAVSIAEAGGGQADPATEQRRCTAVLLL